MGFNQKWIQWMVMCIESVDYSVLVNGEHVGPVIPGRGLRQGDLLSPYLFITCAEGLSSLIRNAEESGTISGTSICRGAPSVSHLLFADDCFLFFKAEESQAHVMKNILNVYEAASGQAISLPKSEIFYSRNVTDDLKNNITNILAVRAVLGTGKYLGMPSMIGRDRTATFAYIKDRVWQRINSWSSKCLSKAGREVMIKSVLQAIPSYVMSLFHLPTTLITTIERMMNSFWWGHGRTTHRGINWLSWEKLSMHKNHGGLGFKDISASNLSMLGKQGWKFLTDPQSLVSRIFKARYFPSKSYLIATIGHNPSYVWRSILRTRFIVCGGARWSIGSGTTIPILDAPRLSNGESIDGNIAGGYHVRDFKVHNLMSEYGKVWNAPLIRKVFSNDIAEAILNTPLFEQVQNDRLIWKAERNGCYTVRRAYRLCVEELVDVSHLLRPGNWRDIWRLKIPPKVKHLVWRMCRGCLTTGVRLQDKGVSCPTNCASCNDNYDDLNHLLFECPLAIQVWNSAGIWQDVQSAAMNSDSAVNTIFYLLQNSPMNIQQRFAAICWSLWKHRNLKIWVNITENSSEVVDRARHLLDDWHEANLPRTDVSVQAGIQQMHSAVSVQQSIQLQQTQTRHVQQLVQLQHSQTGPVQQSLQPQQSQPDPVQQSVQLQQTQIRPVQQLVQLQHSQTGPVQQSLQPQQSQFDPVQQPVQLQHPQTRPAIPHWQPPSTGRFKCNVDAPFSDQFQRTGIGICVRDKSGTFVLAKVQQFGHIYPVAIGEALGLYHALQWMTDMQFDNIDFELDSKIMRDAFHSRKTDVTDFGSIIGACRELFSTSFTNSRVEFTRRQANAAATSLTSPNIYYDIPHCIESIIINEML